MYSNTLAWIRLARNMGVRYILFRLWYALQKRLGIMKYRSPFNPVAQTFISLEEWRLMPVFFIRPTQMPSLTDSCKAELHERVRLWQEGDICFFGGCWLPVSGWHTHPQTYVSFDAALHWSKVKIYTLESGDIKWLWEKSRFSFIYDLIRYDYHFKEDQSEGVFSTIIQWIDANPVNCGPHWVCSQEISLRIFAWTFALHYYQRSAFLTEARLSLILNSLYQQVLHIEENISFSRIAVRNNHVLTETFALYFTSQVYPFFPGSDTRKLKGKKWFTEEIAFQVEDDGTFLQSSMNYHRMVVQLMSCMIRVSEQYSDTMDPVIVSRARSSLHFLLSCQDKKTGWLPNYGNNDGALIFPLSSCAFRDFRPQLYALAQATGTDPDYGPGIWEEEAAWLGLVAANTCLSISSTNAQFNTFEKGGYFTLRDGDTLTFLRCAKYTHRPFQADNLHLDIWINGENIMRDVGTYLYTSTDQAINYFTGTSAHNTVGLGAFNQMRKGPGFIWFDWIKESKGNWREENDAVIFEGWYQGFRQAGRNIRHTRKVTKLRSALCWIIEDELFNAPSDLPMKQFWHPLEAFFDHLDLTACDSRGIQIEPQKEQGWYAESYGVREPGVQVCFTTHDRYIRTVISHKST